MDIQDKPTYFEYFRKLLEDNEPVNALISQLESLPLSEQEDQFITFLTQFVESSNNNEIGFQIGKSVPLTAFGKVGFGYRMAPSLLDAIRFIGRFHQAIVPLVHYAVTEKDGTTSFSIGFSKPVTDQVESVMASGAIYALVSELKLLGARDEAVIDIHLNENSRELAPLYKKHLGIIPKISGEGNFIRLKTELIRIPNPLADEQTFRQICQDLEDMESSNMNDSSFSEKTLRIIKSNLSSPAPLADIAKALNISERQLRFNLRKENTNYQQLVRDCKVEFAKSLLKNRQLPISTIASRLGYKDVATFNHSFKRWTGKTPSELRKEIT